jgi:tRNA pseudouridine38-40 synthase
VRRDGDEIGFVFRADSFLHQMVRSLVGTLVAVGDGGLEPHEVAAILGARDRAASRTNLAPARGLTLDRVVYGRRPEGRPDTSGRG